MQKVFVTLVFSICIFVSWAQKRVVVADFATREPLPKASVFDVKGTFVGISDTKGRLPFFSASYYPLTVRYLGYGEVKVLDATPDTVFMHEYAMELPEMVIESRKHNVLHLMAYVREYSTLTSYTDTITLFREKMVDYMEPLGAKSRFKGWRTPRVLNARSYYRFTNCHGLDSVSDRCNQHFSWTDWMGLPPTARLTATLRDTETATDSVFGKYSITELWRKNADRVTLDIDVLADTASRRWVPDLSSFFDKGVEFERLGTRFNYDNVLGYALDETNLTGYSFNIESRGRGRGMFMFNRRDEPFFVTTYCEVYILDKEYITEKEARRWAKDAVETASIDFLIPTEAPELQPDILRLIARVNNIDYDLTRLSSTPDLKNIGYRAERLNPGQQVLRRLKGIFGIDRLNAKRKWKKNYDEFRRERQKRNNAAAD